MNCQVNLQLQRKNKQFQFNPESKPSLMMRLTLWESLKKKSGFGLRPTISINPQFLYTPSYMCVRRQAFGKQNNCQTFSMCFQINANKSLPIGESIQCIHVCILYIPMYTKNANTHNLHTKYFPLNNYNLSIPGVIWKQHNQIRCTLSPEN